MVLCNLPISSPQVDCTMNIPICKIDVSLKRMDYDVKLRSVSKKINFQVDVASQPEQESGLSILSRNFKETLCFRNASYTSSRNQCTKYA